MPLFSKVFNFMNQLLFTLKTSDVADRAIFWLKKDVKPVIAFSNTMGSFLEDLNKEYDDEITGETLINADFNAVLKKALEGILRITKKDYKGDKEYDTIDIMSLSAEAQDEYFRIAAKIADTTSSLSISPIDVIISKIEKAGYSVAEVTGRKLRVEHVANKSNEIKGYIQPRKKILVNDAFRSFNNNEVYVLMINQSGSTGASAHAVATDKVPPSEVKQRVMIIMQSELDINKEQQKKGRIGRTGQILLPIYEYLISAIPAEQRFMMMLQRKLKSLDASTTSNQEQSKDLFDVPDFLNKYGDKIVEEFLKENPKINDMLDDPLHLHDSKKGDVNDPSLKVSGRVAILSVENQEFFYAEVGRRYDEYVAYLKQVGQYDLRVAILNLEAKTLEKTIVIAGKGTGSTFSGDSILEKCEVNNLEKPFTKSELENIISERLGKNI